MEELKFRLEPQAFEKLREVIKQETSFSSLTPENIKDKTNAYNLLVTWLTRVYELDRKELVDDEGLDINKLFKTTEM